jgi:glutamyl-tRNA synthetase
MAGVLTVSSKLSPFPFSALAIAVFTGAADIVFDESAAQISLGLNGDILDDEDAITNALANARGSYGDKDKVRDTQTVAARPLLTDCF